MHGSQPLGLMGRSPVGRQVPWILLLAEHGLGDAEELFLFLVAVPVVITARTPSLLKRRLSAFGSVPSSDP